MLELMRVEENTINNEIVQTINARDLHSELGVKKDFSDWIKAQIVRGMLEENEDYIVIPQKGDSTNSGKTRIDYILNIDSGKSIAMMSRVKKGKMIRKYFIEIEKKMKLLTPRTYAEALRQLADKEEEKEILLLENKQLEKTKAYISDKKVATALNTASQKSREVNKLKIELDKSKEYCTVKRMQMLNHGQKFNWGLLRSTTREMELDTVDVFDANYGTVKAYHKNVWYEAYNLTF